MCFAIISPVNNIKTYWIKNSITKNSSLPLTEKAPYNGYPEGTATVELLGKKEKYPEAKIAFVFPSKPDSYDEWVYPISHESGCPDMDFKPTKKTRHCNWQVCMQANLVYNKVASDYDVYIYFPNGKFSSPLLNAREFRDFYVTVNDIKQQLNNLLTSENF